MEQKPNVGLKREGSPYSEQECEEIIQKLEALLDGELDQEKEAEVQQLVENCEYCLEQYNVEQSIRKLIRKGFTNIKGPSSLVSSIRATIHKQRGSDTASSTS